MNIYNLALRHEQAQRLKGDRTAIEAELEKETDLYYHGQFDGMTGGRPEQELWINHSYRSGWLDGVAEYYNDKYQVSMEVF